MKIIYEQQDKTVAVMAANPRLLETMDIKDVAKKYVPSGRPFKIVHESEIPSDETFWAAWRVDFTSNDGFGEG